MFFTRSQNWIWVCLLLLGSNLYADTVSVCYQYGCRKTAQINVTEPDKQQLKAFFATVTDPQSERAALKKSVWYLYQVAGQQSPIYQDKRGNYKDRTAEGKMDCVDHSETDTAFLKYLNQIGLMHHHTILKPYYRLRWVVDLHYTSRIAEKETGKQWVIDSWFYDFGAEPVVLTAEEWKNGWYPEDW